MTFGRPVCTRAIRTAFRPREFELYGSGRTDAGVHALGQVAHLELYTSLAPELLRRKLNDELPADIHVIAVDKVPHRFHARHDAVSRSYLYQISRRRTAFGKPFVWWIKEPLKIAAMREKLVGPQIGKWGQLQEWLTDRDDPNDHHRHTSHLFAVFPGRQISIVKTPALAKAAM